MMEVVGRIVLQGLHGKVLHDVEKLDDMGTAAGCRGSGIDGVAPVCAVDGFLNDHFVPLEILHAHLSAAVVDSRHKGFTDRAVVEGVGPVACQKSEGLGKFGLLQDGAGLSGKAAGKEYAVGAVLAQLLELIGDDLGLHGMNLEAFLCQPYCGSGHFGEGHGAVLVKGGEDPLHDTGDAHRLAAEDRFLGFLGSLGSVHVLRGGQGSHFTTLRASMVAMAASMALPPFCRISTPAFDASSWAEDTMPFLE